MTETVSAILFIAIGIPAVLAGIALITYLLFGNQ